MADEAPGHWKHLLPLLTESDLRRDLDYLLKYFKPISLEHLEKWAFDGAELPPNAFHLTVDDGLREAVQTIAPICLEKAVPATFFLTTEFLDNQMLGERHLASLLCERLSRLSEETRSSLLQKVSAAFPAVRDPAHDWADILLNRSPSHRCLLDYVAGELELDQRAWLSEHRPYAELAEISKLLSQGFAVGAHSLTHPYYPQISLGRQVYETMESIRFLETRFSACPCAFAFPFGTDGVDGLFSAVKAERPRTLFFSVGLASPCFDSRSISRIALDSHPTLTADSMIRKALATRLEHRLRGIRSGYHPAVMATPT